jgi:saccharopine dehydrogenase (NAD+, L-glutamate forming)
MPATGRSFDVVLFGATGYVGALTAEYLARNAPAPMRWALAGRNRAKLESARASLAAIAPRLAQLELIDADVADAASMRRLAESARVVITTVGPYIHYGEPLVAACAAAGTDYVDLTGEPEFVDRMWLSHHESARRSGARIVHCCGFDSIPYDLGVLYTVLQLPASVPLRVEGHVRAGGRISAGTYHSAIHACSRLRLHAPVQRARRARESMPQGRRIGPLGGGIHRAPQRDGWLVPAPTIDPQIVRRSAMALDRYGPDFRYGHYIQLSRITQVAGLLAGIGTLVALAQFGPTRRWLLGRLQSGEGPTPEQREKAWFKVRFIGEGGGRRVVTQVSGGDPGYGETAKMLGESAMCLAFDNLPPRAGQLTPAAAMGETLLQRLQKAGIRFNVLEKS